MTHRQIFWIFFCLGFIAFFAMVGAALIGLFMMVIQ